jgi:hypothetical protein
VLRIARTSDARIQLRKSKAFFRLKLHATAGYGSGKRVNKLMAYLVFEKKLGCLARRSHTAALF